jgi:hypothetical protein
LAEESPQGELSQFRLLVVEGYSDISFGIAVYGHIAAFYRIDGSGASQTLPTERDLVSSHCQRGAIGKAVSEEEIEHLHPGCLQIDLIKRLVLKIDFKLRIQFQMGGELNYPHRTDTTKEELVRCREVGHSVVGRSFAGGARAAQAARIKLKLDLALMANPGVADQFAVLFLAPSVQSEAEQRENVIG